VKDAAAFSPLGSFCSMKFSFRPSSLLRIVPDFSVLHLDIRRLPPGHVCLAQPPSFSEVHPTSPPDTGFFSFNRFLPWEGANSLVLSEISPIQNSPFPSWSTRPLNFERWKITVPSDTRITFPLLIRTVDPSLCTPRPFFFVHVFLGNTSFFLSSARWFPQLPACFLDVGRPGERAMRGGKLTAPPPLPASEGCFSLFRWRSVAVSHPFFI